MNTSDADLKQYSFWFVPFHSTLGLCPITSHALFHLKSFSDNVDRGRGEEEIDKKDGFSSHRKVVFNKDQMNGRIRSYSLNKETDPIGFSRLLWS